MSDTISSNTVLIVGAKGRFGRSALQAFKAAGWKVRAFARNWPVEDRPVGVDVVEGDAFSAHALITAAAGCDVIVNALNPPYEHWTKELPRLTANVIDAAEKAGATVMIPANIYNYGANMPVRLSESTPHRPTTKKGKLREIMENEYANVAKNGVQTILLRAGDFIEQAKTGNWFDTYIAAKTSQGKVVYPGPRDQVHAWAYLPDMARAMVELAERRHTLSSFEDFSFEGYNITGDQLIEAMEMACDRKLKVKKMPWPVIKLLGLFSQPIREVLEMRYLWQVPHAVDGQKLQRTLPTFQSTPLADAIGDALGRTSIAA